MHICARFAILSSVQGWLAYGYNQRDYYIFFSNWPGFLLGAFMALSTYSLAPARTRTRLEVSAAAGTLASA